jgi:hypothetical protein
LRFGKIEKIHETKFWCQKLLNIMAECGKEFGEDFTKTLRMATILNWPTLTKKGNNAFCHGIILADNML